MDPRELAAEPLGDRRQRRIERGIAGDAIACGGPVYPPHDEKRLTPNTGIRACEEGFWNAHFGREGRLQHREFLEARQALGKSGRSIGAQHEPLFAVERAARKPRV